MWPVGISRGDNVTLYQPTLFTSRHVPSSTSQRWTTPLFSPSYASTTVPSVRCGRCESEVQDGEDSLQPSSSLRMRNTQHFYTHTHTHTHARARARVSHLRRHGLLCYTDSHEHTSMNTSSKHEFILFLDFACAFTMLLIGHYNPLVHRKQYIYQMQVKVTRSVDIFLLS